MYFTMHLISFSKLNNSCIKLSLTGKLIRLDTIFRASYGGLVTCCSPRKYCHFSKCMKISKFTWMLAAASP